MHEISNFKQEKFVFLDPWCLTYNRLTYEHYRLDYCRQGALKKFLKRGFQFFKKQPIPNGSKIISNINENARYYSQTGFHGNSGFCYICLLRNFVITILKVVGCEDCVREYKLPQ